MKILLKLKREGGSNIDLGNKKYHFKPNEKGHHVAEVSDPAHIKRLLSIPGYHPYDGTEPDDDAPVAAPAETVTADDAKLDVVDDDDPDFEDDDDPALIGSATLPSTIVIAEGVEVQLGDIVTKAFEVSSLTAKEWNALSQEERDAMLDEQITIQKEVATSSISPATGQQNGDQQGADAVATTANAGAPANATAGQAVDTRSPAQKRKDTLASKAAAGGNAKPSSTKPKKNPALKA
jgi:hypothetical protein